MNKFLTIATVLFSLQGVADSVTCTLTHNEEVSTATMDLDRAADGASSDESISSGGLSFLLIGYDDTCNASKCQVVVSFESSVVEDQVGETGFDVVRSSNENSGNAKTTKAKTKKSKTKKIVAKPASPVLVHEETVTYETENDEVLELQFSCTYSK